jgi:farnesyl diphosphate synthase
MFQILRKTCARTVLNKCRTSDGIKISSQNRLLFNDLLTNSCVTRQFNYRLNSTSNASAPKTIVQPIITSEQTNDFMATFPDIVRDLTDKVKEFDQTDAAEWLEKALYYNVPRGKKNRGLATVLAYKTLCEPSLVNAADLQLANYLGWCVELLQAMFLIEDDIMDGSETRRGDLCWYKLKDVNLIAINDGIMLENCLYYILKKHFREKSYYVDLLDVFHELALITTFGQSLDMQTALKDVHQFTMDRYNSVVTLKTAYYTFYLPIALAMHMVGHSDAKLHQQAKGILLKIGIFFQIQDDYIDCYGDPKISGKIGTDIQDNKCSWLAVTCMERATVAQKAIMAENYGQHDEKKVAKIRELYNEIGLRSIYELYERESYESIRAEIEQLPTNISHTIFYNILDKIYKRDC